MADTVPNFMKMGKYEKKKKATSCFFILLFEIQFQNVHPFPIFFLAVQFLYVCFSV